LIIHSDTVVAIKVSLTDIRSHLAASWLKIVCATDTTALTQDFTKAAWVATTTLIGLYVHKQLKMLLAQPTF
jgi:hypothetical protein